MSEALNLLHVEDSLSDAALIEHTLTEAGYTVHSSGW